MTTNSRFPLSPRFLLPIAAMPALAASLWLMTLAGAGRSVLLVQIVSSLVAGTICLFGLLGRDDRPPAWIRFLVMTLGTVLLFLPLGHGGGDGPQRWLSLAGFRLYLGAAILPALLLGLPELMRQSGRARGLGVALLLMSVAALSLQPDAPQATAAALAAQVFWLDKKSAGTLGGIVLPSLAILLFLAWRQPDPLQPVSYVEGVLDLAGRNGMLALVAMLVCLATPILALLWLARRLADPGVLAVAIYYGVIGVMAYCQKTPMPLLGYGVGPILGYFIMAFGIGRRIHRSQKIRLGDPALAHVP